VSNTRGNSVDFTSATGRIAAPLTTWPPDRTLTGAATKSDADGADDRRWRYVRAPGGGARAEPRDRPPAWDDPTTQAQPRDPGCYGTAAATGAGLPGAIGAAMRRRLWRNPIIANEARRMEPDSGGPVAGPRQPRASRAREVHRNVTARRLLCHSCRIRSPAPARAGGSFPIKHECG